MISTSIVFAAYGVLVILAVRRWYLALLGLVVLTPLTEYWAMPRKLFGVQGLNPWNAAFLAIGLAFFLGRRPEERGSPAGRGLVALAVLEAVLIAATGLAGTLDAGSVKSPIYAEWLTASGMLVDGVINPLKYFLVAVLVYLGTVDRERARLALAAAVGSGLVYAALVFRTMKLRIFTLAWDEVRDLCGKMVGIHPNDLARPLAFTLLAALMLAPLLAKRWQRFLLLSGAAAAVPCFLGMMSRGGFLAFCMAVVVLGVLRWRKLLLLFPLGVVLVVALKPSVAERALMGVERGGPYVRSHDWDEISAGRITKLWPPVLDQIGRSPLIGHGRYAIVRERCYEQILLLEGSVPSHPHNAYLEVLLDGGVAGLAVCLLLMALVTRASLSLMREREDLLLSRAGAISLAGVVVVMTSSLSGHSFFPNQATVPFLVVWGVALRLRDDARAAAAEADPDSAETVSGADLQK